MLKQVILLFSASILLCACASGTDGHLKKSANNKLFDRKGFHGEKRPPLYNKQYISKAKNNIVNKRLDDDDLEDEEPIYEKNDYSKENIEMYKAMIKEDHERKVKKDKKFTWWWNRNKKSSYPSAKEANSKIDPEIHAQNLELKEELNQIKAMLSQTRKEMSSYQCPNSEQQEASSEQNRAKKQKKSERPNYDNLPRPTLNLLIPEDLEQKTKEIDTPDHVHSI